MKIQRSWLSLLANCILLASGAAFAFAVVLAGASVALAGHEGPQSEESQAVAPLPQTSHSGSSFSGMITDSRCGARHMRNSHLNSTECARECVRRGASYILVDGDRRYTLIGNDFAISQLAGERAKITGTRQGDAIVVDAANSMF